MKVVWWMLAAVRDTVIGVMFIVLMILWCCVLGRWSDAMSLWEFILHNFRWNILLLWLVFDWDLARRIWREFDKLRELTRGINSSSWNLGHLLKEALVNLRISLLSREYKSPPPASTRSPFGRLSALSRLSTLDSRIAAVGSRLSRLSALGSRLTLHSIRRPLLRIGDALWALGWLLHRDAKVGRVSFFLPPLFGEDSR